MQPSPESRDSSTEDLRTQVRELRERLENLERHLGLKTVETGTPPTAWGREPEGFVFAGWGDAARLTTLLGLSFLGLAFAYLLRLLTESSAVPVTVGVGLGMAYALGWLLWAARTPPAETLTISMRALTSVLIVAPLLWEAEVRWQALSSWMSAGALLLFSLAGLGISWQKNLTSVAWITSLAGIGVSLALIIATRDLLPFTIALLALAAAVEASACLEHWLGERWIVAAAANLAVALTTYIQTRSGGVPDGYALLSRPLVLGIQIALLAVYLSSTFVRTLGLGFRIRSFEIGQCLIAFLIFGLGAIRVAQGHPAMVLTVGMFCALCATASYGVSFAFLGKHPEKDRNFHVYAAFGMMLAMAGTWLAAGTGLLTLIYSVLAILFVAVGRRAERMTLKWHAAAFLFVATLASGNGTSASRAYLGSSGHAAGAPGLAAYVISAAAGAASILAWRVAGRHAGSSNFRAVTAVLTALAVWNLAGLAGGLATPVCIGQQGENYCPAIFTALLASFVLALAWASRRWDSRELRWLSVLYLALSTYKLIIQDLQHSQTLSVSISLLIYGGTLVLLPRLLKKPRPGFASTCRESL